MHIYGSASDHFRLASAWSLESELDHDDTFAVYVLLSCMSFRDTYQYMYISHSLQIGSYTTISLPYISQKKSSRANIQHLQCGLIS